MSATLIGYLLGGAGVILFFVWIVRRNKKFGRLEADGERLAENAESMGKINEMERMQDEKSQDDFSNAGDAGDYLSGRVRDKPGDR